MNQSFKRFGSAVFALCLLFVGLAAVHPAQADDSPLDGITTSAQTITLGDELTISYQTQTPQDQNWIGIYPEGETPGGGLNAPVWKYAPGSTGTVVWDSATNAGWETDTNRPITPGNYSVYLFVAGDYEPIGDPVALTVTDEAPHDGVTTSAQTMALGDELTVSYQTETPNAQNWIGIYPVGETPGDLDAPVWKYAPGSTGTAVWDSATNAGWETNGNSSVAPGIYSVYLFAKDGYEPIGDPVGLTVEEYVSSSEIELSTTELSEGDELDITYSGDEGLPLEIGIFTRPQTAVGAANVPDLRLPLESVNGTATWNSADDPKWQGDSSALGSGEYHVGLFEKGDYSRLLTDYEAFTFQPVSEPEVSSDPVDLNVLAFNIWKQGTSIPNGIAEVAKVIEETDADIIFTSEGNEGISKVAKELNYNYYDSRGTDPYAPTIDAGVISKYPILEAESLDGNWWQKVVVEVNGHEIAAYSGHLDHQFYVPYLPRGYGGFTPSPWPTSEYGWDKMPEPITDVDLILELNEASGRPGQANALVADAQGEQEQGRIVIMGGDLNEPSHQDWIEETKDLLDHSGTVVPWQTTSNLVAGGFVDAYRSAHPNPVTHPGTTWPSDNPLAETTEITQAPDADERDRIDYVFFMPDERLKLREAVVVGPKTTIVRNKRVPEVSDDVIFEPEADWPSDHKAVLSQFTLGETNVEPEPDPEPEPEPSPEPEPEPEPSSEPETSPDPESNESETPRPEAGDDLANTGSSVQPWLLIVAGLSVTGGALAYSLRKASLRKTT